MFSSSNELLIHEKTARYLHKRFAALNRVRVRARSTYEVQSSLSINILLRPYLSSGAFLSDRLL